jgi:hypothetical protein
MMKRLHQNLSLMKCPRFSLDIQSIESIEGIEINFEL